MRLLAIVLAVAGCGGRVDASGAGWSCFPALTDCRDGGCEQGRVCLPRDGG